MVPSLIPMVLFFLLCLLFFLIVCFCVLCLSFLICLFSLFAYLLFSLYLLLSLFCWLLFLFYLFFLSFFFSLFLLLVLFLFLDVFHPNLPEVVATRQIPVFVANAIRKPSLCLLEGVQRSASLFVFWPWAWDRQDDPTLRGACSSS